MWIEADIDIRDDRRKTIEDREHDDECRRANRQAYDRKNADDRDEILAAFRERIPSGEKKFVAHEADTTFSGALVIPRKLIEK